MLKSGSILRWLVILSGAFETAFGVSIFLFPHHVIAAMAGGEPDATALLLGQVLGAATASLGIAAIRARDELKTESGRGIASGLTLYNILAALATRAALAAGLGGGALWIAGGVHAAIGALLVFCLLASRGKPDRDPQSSCPL
jgi:hypothetical protein